MNRILSLTVIFLLVFTGCVREENRTPTELSQQWENPTVVQTQPPQSPMTDPELLDPTDPLKENVMVYSDFKGIWLSQFDLSPIYLENGVQRGEADFVNRMAQVLDNVKMLGFNTVMLQIRPYGDSMYPSVYYPMSKYVVGQYGNVAQYDPVAIIVELAKERNLAIHAWINPMRCMETEEICRISDDYPIRQWYDDPNRNGTWIVHSGKYWYLNPAYEEVRNLIIAGAAEILERYDFDGLHMDDYFYPTSDASFDAVAYAELGGGLSLEEFRRNNLNKLVASLYETTKEFHQSIMFGISPAGNMNTVYQQQYADVYTWCSEEGYIDYICPQVYFGLEHQNFDFVSVCNTWQDIILADNIDLIIGMSFEKALTLTDNYAGTGQNEWREHTDILKRCLQYTVELEKCSGVCVFSYQHFYDPVTGEEIAGTAAEREEFVPALATTTWWHRGGVG